MLRTIAVAAGAFALVACGQQAQTETAEAPPSPELPAPTAPAASDAEFVQAVANADAFEIQSSELAVTRAARQDVKNFATMMLRDHRATTSELTALAPRVNLPAPTPQLDATHSARLDVLREARGEAFDDAYLDAQTETHENAVRAFETYIASAQAGPLRDWATATLPKLRTHLSQVQALENAT